MIMTITMMMMTMIFDTENVHIVKIVIVVTTADAYWQAINSH